MDHLRRELAPLTDKAWDEVDAEAERTLRHLLAGRPLVGFTGPLGWQHNAHPLGRAHTLTPAPAENVRAARRLVQPLVEMRTTFEVPFEEIEAIDRGAPDPDLSAVVEAARRAALAEDQTVFHGYKGADIVGITPSSPHTALAISDNYDQYPGIVARAVDRLRTAGVGGPYAIALGPRCYTGVIEATERGGYPLLEHIKLIVGGPIVWAPAVDGAVVLSLRGGDYELICGQDFSIGYAGESPASVELYIEETMTFAVREGGAAIPLVHSA